MIQPTPDAGGTGEAGAEDPLSRRRRRRGKGVDGALNTVLNPGSGLDLIHRKSELTTVRVNDWVALLPTPLAALIVNV